MLADDGNSRVLAGGQTLIPMLAMRLARPSCLVDITRIPELSGIRDAGTFVAIGAATRQVVAERDPLVARKVPLLAKALPWVGHAPTRNRGTIGGSVANGDPAAEIALVAVTLDATLVVQTAEETSELAAAEFYLGPMITALPEGGILTSVHFPVWAEGRIGTASTRWLRAKATLRWSQRRRKSRWMRTAAARGLRSAWAEPAMCQFAWIRSPKP